MLRLLKNIFSKKVTNKVRYNQEELERFWVDDMYPIIKPEEKKEGELSDETPREK